MFSNGHILAWPTKELIVDLMGRIHLVLIVAFLFLSSLTAFADDVAPNPSADSASGLSLTAGRDVVLMPGEHVPLVIFDSKANKPVQVAKISWAIDGQSIDQAPATAGALSVPDDNPFSTNTIYTAPAQPTTQPIELKATVGTDAPVALTTKVTIVNDPNWFVIEGDITPHNPLVVTIQITSGFPSTAGVHHGPNPIEKDRYFVTVWGVDKNNPKTHAESGLNLGRIANDQTGTFQWATGNSQCGAVLVYNVTAYSDLTLDRPGKFDTLGGSTTLLEPGPNDNSGLVKGFYSGNLNWVEMLPGGGPPRFKTHYVTVRGHFAVPKYK